MKTIRNIFFIQGCLFFMAYGYLNPVRYDYDSFVLTPYRQMTGQVTGYCKQKAKKTYGELEQAKFFNEAMLKNPAQVLQAWKKDPSHTEITYRSNDLYIDYSLFKRNSSTLLIVGPGFTNSKEKMAPFVEMFSNYDVAVLNFRGQHYNQPSFNPLYACLGINSVDKLGACQVEDVINVITQLRPPYKQIIGLGICFGGFVFIKAQSMLAKQNKKLFDKIIVDGCWFSMDTMRSQLQEASLPSMLSFIDFSWYVKKLFGLDEQDLNLRHYLNDFRIPILFFYGKYDKVVSRAEFEQIWQGIGSRDKIAIITSNPHVQNHMQERAWYKMSCEAFIQHNSTYLYKQLVQKQPMHSKGKKK